MDTIPLNNFNRRDNAGLVLDCSRYTALAIGPGSLGDSVRVNGQVLVAGQVLPVGGQVRVEPHRAYRHGSGFATSGEVIDYLELVGWTRHDTPHGFARSPVSDAVATNYGTVGVTSRLMRFPFQGRRQAQICIHGVAGGGSLTVDWSLYGVRFRGRDEVLRSGASTSTRYVLLSTAAAVPIGSAGPSGDYLSTISYLGGTDSAEFFDELEIWTTTGGSAGSTDVYATIDAWGELAGEGAG